MTEYIVSCCEHVVGSIQSLRCCGDKSYLPHPHPGLDGPACFLYMREANLKERAA